MMVCCVVMQWWRVSGRATRWGSCCRGGERVSGCATWWGSCGGGATWQNIDIIKNSCWYQLRTTWWGSCCCGGERVSGCATWWGSCGGGATWQNIDIIKNICWYQSRNFQLQHTFFLVLDMVFLVFDDTWSFFRKISNLAKHITRLLYMLWVIF